MRAWLLSRPRWPTRDGAARATRARTSPAPGIRARSPSTSTCAASARTDLHVVEGDLAPHRPNGRARCIRCVGRASALRTGSSAERARVGIAWLWRACGTARLRGVGCVAERAPRYGLGRAKSYAERAARPRTSRRAARRARRRDVAPLPGAGIIGYRGACAVQRIEPGGATGPRDFGFGAHRARRLRAHLVVYGSSWSRARRRTARLARRARRRVGGRLSASRPARAARRGGAVRARRHAGARGARGARGPAARSPARASTCPRSRRSTTPRSCSRSGRLTSVTANTRADGRALLELAARASIRPRTDRVRVSPTPTARCSR